MDPAGQAIHMATLHATKKALRRDVAEKLRSLTKQSVDQQSRIVADALFSRDEYKTASRISVFLSMSEGEVQTEPIVRKALRDGKKIFVPYIHKAEPASEAVPASTTMTMLALHSESDYSSLQPDKWGIPSLSAETVQDRENWLGRWGTLQQGADNLPLKGLDLILVPAVAFDFAGGRLGHGKGYYDRFITQCVDLYQAHQAVKMPSLIGLALQEQLLPEEARVPTSDFDRSVDTIITGGGSTVCKGLVACTALQA